MKNFSSILRIVSTYMPESIKATLGSKSFSGIRSWYDHNSGKTFFISYPKSGRTWLRILIGKAILLHLKKEDLNPLSLSTFSKYDSRIPKIIVNHGLNRPGIRTPEELSFNFDQYTNSKVLFMVRHPADVVVSLYYHISKRNSEYHGSISDFIRGRRGGIDTIIAYLNEWAKASTMPKDFLIIKYEDLHSDPLAELKRVFRFIELGDIEEDLLKEAIEFASFRNMRKIEKSKELNASELSPTNEQDTQTYKTRKGQVGGYLEELNEEDIAYLEDKIKSGLSPIYGYN